MRNVFKKLYTEIRRKQDVKVKWKNLKKVINIILTIYEIENHNK